MAVIEGPSLNVSRNGAIGLTPALRRQNGMWSNKYISDYPLTYSLGQSYQGTQDYVDSLIKPYNFKVDFSNNTSNVPTSTNSGTDSAKAAPGSVDDFIKRFQDMGAWDALKLQWKMNPIGTTTSLIGSGLDVANSIWSSFQNYRTAKQAMDLANKDYELKKQAYEANEARNQEKFDWLKQSRATSQL